MSAPAPDLAATVVMPTTGDRSAVLPLSVGSVLAQTVADIELLVIGDGAAEPSRAVIRRLAEADPRIRFFDHPKGARRGETYRHDALATARGRIVTYLCDRDLMLPWNVETLVELLDGADFAHSLCFRISPDGRVFVHNAIDLAHAEDRRDLLAGWRPRNGIPLSCGAHTLDMYRRLPHGWRTTPEGRTTDTYMWEQFLSEPSCRARSGTRPCVLTFHTRQRHGWTPEDRAAELRRWLERLDAPGGHADLVEALLADVRERQLWAERAWRSPLRTIGRRLVARIRRG